MAIDPAEMLKLWVYELIRLDGYSLRFALKIVI
jgi:hypothetical protein